MKRILFATLIALVATSAFAASESFQLPDGTAIEVMHPGVDGVTRPVARADARVVPAYPQLPQPLSEASNVVMAVLVDQHGDAITLDVLDASHPGLGFEDSAAEALFKWKFEPATLDGKPVISYTKVRVNFPERSGMGGGLVGSMVPGGADVVRDRNPAAPMTPTLSATKTAGIGTPHDGEATPEAPAAAGRQPESNLERGRAFRTAPEGQLYFRGHPEWGYKLYGGDPTDPDTPWR
jgi:hypothetical protein